MAAVGSAKGPRVNTSVISTPTHLAGVEPGLGSARGSNLRFGHVVGIGSGFASGHWVGMGMDFALGRLLCGGIGSSM